MIRMGLDTFGQCQSQKGKFFGKIPTRQFAGLSAASYAGNSAGDFAAKSAS
jgi:hypothetical protein